MKNNFNNLIIEFFNFFCYYTLFLALYVILFLGFYSLSILISKLTNDITMTILIILAVSLAITSSSYITEKKKKELKRVRV